jgi:lysozyme family protein
MGISASHLGHIEGVMLAMTAFEHAFSHVIGNEGGFADNQLDPGNWTSGKAGVGECRGTKFGISAHAYPNVDIRNITLDEARAIYRRDYWDKVQADTLPGPLALLAFDAAVNNGIGRAGQWLAAARKQSNGAAICTEFQAQRLFFMASLPTWKVFGLGWSRRLCRLPYQSLTMTE